MLDGSYFVVEYWDSRSVEISRLETKYIFCDRILEL